MQSELVTAITDVYDFTWVCGVLVQQKMGRSPKIEIKLPHIRLIVDNSTSLDEQQTFILHSFCVFQL